MCTQSKADTDSKKIILGYPANTHDAEKACMVIENLIEDNGFEDLVDNNFE